MPNEIIIYQPNDVIQLDVRVEEETVWLNRQQMAVLFGRDVKTIGKHINNALAEELSGLPTVANFATVQKEGTRHVSRNVEYYNLDVILSVGYRVKSPQGILFRKWANGVLKDYLIKGYAIDDRLQRMEKKICEHDEQIGLLIKTSLPPREGVFVDGQIYDAYEFAHSLLMSAKQSITIIDNYIDVSVLTMLSEKAEEVQVRIYTRKVPSALELAIDKFNQQYKGLAVYETHNVHDRFLILDDTTIYLIGASLKDLGKKLFAVTRLDLDCIKIIQKCMEVNQETKTTKNI